MADPFAQYIAPESDTKGGDPFAQYVQAEAPAAAPAAAPAKPSFLDAVKARVGGYVDRLATEASSLSLPTSLGDAAARVRQNLPGLAEPFKDLGRGVAAANDAAARVMTSPVQTLGDGKAGSFMRETLRGVNSNIPLANLAVEHMGGPAEVSTEDAARAPGARELGALAGAPVAGMEGAIAARVAGPAARVLKGLGQGAEERTVGRAIDKLETRTSAKTRKGLQKGAVEDLVREDPAVRSAAGNDKKLAKQVDQVKERAGKELDDIYTSASPEVDLAVPVMRMDARIAELAAGDAEERAAAKALQGIRDEFNDAMGGRQTVSPRDLRKEQSAYQKLGYSKNIDNDPDVGARIRANREASKAVGDAVVEHVTGMDYEAARAAAAADSDSLAAHLLKANDRFSAANRIEAAIEDRARRVQKGHGLAGTLMHEAKEIKHSPSGWALSKIPKVAAAGLDAADSALARRAPAASGALEAAGQGAAQVAPATAARGLSPDDVLEQLIARADSGDPDAEAKLAAVSQAPIVAARVSVIRRRMGGVQ